MNAYQFFLRNQSGDPSPQDRIRVARALADAERRARDAGYYWVWYEDSHGWRCEIKDLSMHEVARRECLDFEDGEPCNPGKRLVESELALEVWLKTAKSR